MEEVKRDVLFYGWDPGSVGNGTAVSSPLTGAIMLPGKSRDEKWDQRDRLSQLPVEESGGLARSSGGRGPGSPDSSYYSYHHLIFLILFHPALREGVSRETRGGDTPPAFSHMAIGTGGGRGRRPPENRTEPLVWGRRMVDGGPGGSPSSGPWYWP